MARQTKPLLQKLHDIPGAIRFAVDNPLFAGEGFGTLIWGNMLAANVFGRDEQQQQGVATAEDASGQFCFSQEGVDGVIHTTGEFIRPKSFGGMYALSATCGQAFLSISISDTNKQLMLSSDLAFLDVMRDGLLLDTAHPRMSDGQTQFEAIKARPFNF